ncbi:hypothetical protein Zm00014a_017845 [Zea mays]|uniref:Uncharacterized protein n=1 Tax=Zea mays TaxID=4577 RepID=A0A3L6DYB5_MAIZE|nr:hypothetical protein Zm00014a_017845 [Zea mays]
MYQPTRENLVDFQRPRNNPDIGPPAGSSSSPDNIPAQENLIDNQAVSLPQDTQRREMPSIVIPNISAEPPTKLKLKRKLFGDTDENCSPTIAPALIGSINTENRPFASAELLEDDDYTDMTNFGIVKRKGNLQPLPFVDCNVGSSGGRGAGVFNRFGGQEPRCGQRAGSQVNFSRAEAASSSTAVPPSAEALAQAVALINQAFSKQTPSVSGVSLPAVVQQVFDSGDKLVGDAREETVLPGKNSEQEDVVVQGAAQAAIDISLLLEFTNLIIRTKLSNSYGLVVKQRLTIARELLDTSDEVILNSYDTHWLSLYELYSQITL